MSLRLIVLVLAASLTSCASKSVPSNVSHGHRLATVMGCISCHGEKLDGHLFEEDPKMVLAWSSNLSRILPHWSDEQIETTLRTGKRPDGTALWFMPSFSHRRLAQEDMRDLIAWLRTVPAAGIDHPPMKRGPMFEQAIARGYQDSAAEALRLADRQPVDLGPSFAHGRYLAMISCSECHGPDFKGVRDPRPGDPPDLGVAASYTPEAFARLLKTGIAQNGQPAAGMAEEARKRLSALTPTEMEAIRSYLAARAKR